jgi:1-acyl-sn-glycerol-3-phosphate acyltransferase
MMLASRLRGRSLGNDIERIVRTVFQAVLLVPLVKWFCRPLRVIGAPVGDAPAIFVANHTSHADTGLVLAALPRRMRADLAPAAAADYFFASRARGTLVRLLVGAFAFPRKGSDGLRRAGEMLRSGRSVLLFPEGTRARDGRMGRFKPGVGHLARSGAPVVPVAIKGPAAILPKGRRFPRRAPATVIFGAPIHFAPDADPDAVARRLEAEIAALQERADLPDPVPTLYRCVRAFARSRAALVVAALWGIAEAIWFPIVPDFFVAPLALACPARALPLVLAATAGSVTGGAVSYLVGPELLSVAPLVTSRMVDEAGGLLAREGAAALWEQPLSGIPYKVFALQAAPVADLLPFLTTTAAARGARILVVALLFALGGIICRRLLDRLYGLALALYAAAFFVGLARVVAAWS